MTVKTNPTYQGESFANTEELWAQVRELEYQNSKVLDVLFFVAHATPKTRADVAARIRAAWKEYDANILEIE